MGAQLEIQQYLITKDQRPSGIITSIRNQAWFQIIILSLCHFCSLGMWNALNGIGSLGTGDERLSHYCNTVAYLAGIPAGFMAGGVLNVLGLRRAALLGLTGQGLNLLAYFAYYYLQLIPLWLVALWGAVASLGLSCLTSAIGSGLVHYPTESQRNAFIAVNSVILNLGGFSGAIVAFTLNETPLQGQVALSTGSYLCIVIIGCSGVLIGLLLVEPEKVVKKDGTQITVPKRKPIEEMRAVFQGFKDFNLWLLVPLFLASVWHEVVLFNFFNSTIFNVRSRALNSASYYSARIIASWLFQLAADVSSDVFVATASATGTLIVFLALGILPSAAVFLNFLGLRDARDLDLEEPRAFLLTLCFFAYGALETMAASYSKSKIM